MHAPFPRIAVLQTSFTLFLVLAVPSAEAATYYVRKTGNDSNSGTSTATAWLTITKAANTMIAGDTVYVGAGTYSEQVKSVRNATSGNAIRFVADTTGAYTGDAGTVGITKSGVAAVIIDHNYHEVIGFRVFSSANGPKFTGGVGSVLQDCEVDSHSSPGIVVSGGSTSVTITNCTCHNNSDHGLDANSGPTIVASRCSFYNNANAGINLGQSSTLNVTFNRCKSYSNTAEGVTVAQGTGIWKNCQFYDNGKSGVRVSGTSTNKNFTFWNCTIVANGEQGVWASQSTVTVKNCMMTNNAGYGLKDDVGTTAHTYNLLYSNTSGNYNGTSASTGELSSDPLFTNYATRDLHLNTGSAAINTGTNAAGTVDDDYDGTARPIGAAWDMGCYEASGSGSPTGVHILKWVESQ